MKFYTYILESESTGTLYIGQTANIDDRLYRHNNGKSRFTKGKGPWKIIFSKELDSRTDAILLENKLKGFKNREKVKNWIQKQISEPLL